MGLITGLTLIILGGLCIPGIIAKKSPKAKELLNKIVPLQGTLGIALFAWGIWGIIGGLTSLSWLGSWPLWWTTRLAGNVICFAGGAILGWGMIQKLILKKAPADVVAKAENAYLKLVSFQEKIGITAIIVGIWVILYELILQGILNI